MIEYPESPESKQERVRQAANNDCLLLITKSMSLPYGLLASEAIFSNDMKYRYTLKRVWSNKPLVAFIGLNPSTADHIENDPTVTRCINYARLWGYGGMVMLNIFAYRSTDPQALYTQPDPVGPKNDHYIHETAKAVESVIACWGNHGSFNNRSAAILKAIPTLKCFGLTKQGQPKHPLYLKSSAALINFK